jgi:hypothetical protein
MASGLSVVLLPSFMKICLFVQNLLVGHTSRHRQHAFRIDVLTGEMILDNFTRFRSEVLRPGAFFGVNTNSGLLSVVLFEVENGTSYYL